MRISEDSDGLQDSNWIEALTTGSQFPKSPSKRSSSLLWTCSSSDNCLLTVRSSNQKEGPVMTREGLVPKYPKYLRRLELLMGGADL